MTASRVLLDELRAASDDCDPAPRDVEAFEARLRVVVALPFPLRVVSFGGGISSIGSLSLGLLSSMASMSKRFLSRSILRNSSPTTE